MTKPNEEECCKKPMPFIESAFETAKQVIRKPGFASNEAQLQRLEICRACEHFDSVASRCKICGCKMLIKVKGRGTRCPDNPPRWEAEP